MLLIWIFKTSKFLYAYEIKLVLKPVIIDMSETVIY